jgi:hypothetical protein
MNLPTDKLTAHLNRAMKSLDLDNVPEPVTKGPASKYLA